MALTQREADIQVRLIDNERTARENMTIIGRQCAVLE